MNRKPKAVIKAAPPVTPFWPKPEQVITKEEPVVPVPANHVTMSKIARHFNVTFATVSRWRDEGRLITIDGQPSKKGDKKLVMPDKYPGDAPYLTSGSRLLLKNSAALQGQVESLLSENKKAKADVAFLTKENEGLVNTINEIRKVLLSDQEADIRLAIAVYLLGK